MCAGGRAAGRAGKREGEVTGVCLTMVLSAARAVDEQWVHTYRATTVASLAAALVHGCPAGVVTSYTSRLYFTSPSACHLLFRVTQFPSSSALCLGSAEKSLTPFHPLSLTCSILLLTITHNPQLHTHLDPSPNNPPPLLEDLKEPSPADLPPFSSTSTTSDQSTIIMRFTTSSTSRLMATLSCIVLLSTLLLSVTAAPIDSSNANLLDARRPDPQAGGVAGADARIAARDVSSSTRPAQGKPRTRSPVPAFAVVTTKSFPCFLLIIIRKRQIRHFWTFELILRLCR